MTLLILARQASENMSRSLKKSDPRGSQDLKEIHKLLVTITQTTSHIETQNDAIITENRKLREENSNLEYQLKLLVQRNKEMNYEIDLLINQNKEIREALDEFQVENNRLRTDLKQQNTKMRMIIESLKSQNSKLRQEVDDGVHMLRWSQMGNNKTARKKKAFWKHLCS